MRGKLVVNSIPNNPRSIGDAVSLDAWRTAFDSKTGIADVFVDIVFGVAQLGGGDVPVRFRLALRGASVHVNVGNTGILSILPETVHRVYSPTPPRSVTETVKSGSRGAMTVKVAAGASTALNQTTGQLSLDTSASGDRSVETSKEVSVAYTTPSMTVVHRKTHEGYAFDITTNNGQRLAGLPWDPSTRRLSIADNDMYRRVGDPPEPLIEITVRREQIEIFDVEFTSISDNFMNMHKNKQMIAIQHLKSVLLEQGFEIANLNEPFASVKIADVSPQEKRGV